MSDTSKSQLENILIILPLPEPTEELKDLRTRLPNCNIKYITFSGEDNVRTVAYSGTDASTLYKDIDVLITLFVLPDNPKRDAPRLKLVHFYSAGIDRAIGNPIYTDPNITITSSSGVHGPQIAEWVVMTGLIQTHFYNALRERQKEHSWAPLGSEGRNLSQIRDRAGQRMGVLGYGSIGRQVGRVAKALGMDVVAFTASEKSTAESRRDRGYIVPGTGDPEGEIPSKWFSGLDRESLHRFLRQELDWLVICMPLTKDTHHLLRQQEFLALAEYKPCFISNISRGPIIKQDDLIEALKDGTVSGAALDVTDPEPLPSDHPLWDAPNVIITPHVSGFTAKYTERSFEICASNVERWTEGKGLINTVNRDRGY